MKLALAQINTTVGDLRGNANKVSDYCRKARDLGASLVVFPELTLTGYPPLDLLESGDFVAREQRTRDGLAKTLPANLGVLIGGLARNSGHGKPLHNAAYLYENGDCVGVCHKQLLPDYDVFDERRHFAPGADPTVLRWRGFKLGVHICEDLWNVRESTRRSYAYDPIATLAGQAPDLFINLCASPFAIDKHLDRYQLMETVWQRYRRSYVFTNLVGANTGLIFDGRSCVIQGSHVLEAAPFNESLLIWDSSLPPGSEPVPVSPTQQVLEALKLGILDYVEKTGVFEQVFVGLSGGIDSAVTAALAVQALGPQRVVGVAMPSAFSSSGSLEDASQLASNLGIELHTIPIHKVIDAFNNTLKDQFSGLGAGVAEENIQARTRGTLLMAFANKFNGMVLATGNKSELATGYATLYGDMNGGLAVLGDLYKTEVYELARLINATNELIPESSITKPPSAELRPNQVDQDSLPPYDILDEVLKCYIERRLSADEIVSCTGYARTLVESITLMVDRAEYKREQAAPVLRLRRKAFGSGRREPIVARRT